MFNYQFEDLKTVFAAIIRQNVASDAWSWMEEKTSLLTSLHLNAAFAMMPRKTGRAVIHVTEEQNRTVQAARPGLSIRGWTIDRLSRVWLLMQVEAREKETYFRQIENLFLAAEMQELVALYSALPVLAYPEMWEKRCAEGIRSNIGDVLEAIMCNNPYPSENLSEAAWNQLVLKAFFTEKPIHRIIGLDSRANQELASILSDYAHERWAAHRAVNPQLWRCVGPFINERILPDIERLFHSEKIVEREAAALACWHSNFPPARDRLNQNAELKAAIEAGRLTWDTVVEKAMLVQQ
jgi:hypothetical protein